MSPSAVNEVRMLQPVIWRMTLRIIIGSTALSLFACCVLLGAAIRVMLIEEEVWASTTSGHVFRITPIAPEKAHLLLQQPGAVAAVAEATR